MTNFRKISYIFLTAAITFMVVAVFNGCSMKSGTKGGLLLSVSDDNFKPMIMLPDGDYTTDHYTVSLDSQTTTDHFEQTVPASQSSIEFNNLPSGMTYDISVLGFNVASEPITNGSGTIFITTNVTEEKTITVDWFRDGQGYFEYNIALNPVDVVCNPELEIDWYDGTAWSAITPTDNGDGTFTISGNYDPGFYGIAVRLYSDGDSYVLVSGLAEAIFILKEMDTTGAIEFNVDNTNVSETGGALIIVIEPVDSPIQMGFVDAPSSWIVGSELTLASTAESTITNYSWYKDGLLLSGETGTTLTDTVAAAGWHHYTVFGYEGNVTASATVGIAFLDNIFSDAVLEVAVRTALGIPEPTPIMPDDMLGLTEISIHAVNIFDLEGMQYAVNMTDCDLGNNDIVDISPLENLTALTDLVLSSNDITDLSPLAGLVNLDIIDLCNNPFSEVTALVENHDAGNNGPVVLWVQSCPNLSTQALTDLAYLDINWDVRQ